MIPTLLTGLPWRLIGAGAVLALLVWLGLIVNGWRTDAAQVPVLEDRIKTAAAQIEQDRLAIQKLKDDRQFQVSMAQAHNDMTANAQQHHLGMLGAQNDAQTTQNQAQSAMGSQF